jgi:hypothetical protein
VLVGVAVGLACCASNDEDRAAIAAAKCSLPVSEKAGFPENSLPQYEANDVEDLKEGRYRVTGRSTVVGEVTKAVEFVCEVAPDDSDKLRGFKVTRLDVTPLN